MKVLDLKETATGLVMVLGVPYDTNTADLGRVLEALNNYHKGES